MTSIILAGGRSSRLGREKSEEQIEGRSLISRVISCLSSLSDEILVVVSKRQIESQFPSYTGATTVVDVYPEKGSLGGIYTGLVCSTSFYNLAVACDMPFLNLDLLRYIAALSPGFDVVIPELNGRREPLHAVYTKNCLPSMESLLKTGNLRVADFPDSVRARYVNTEVIDRFDPDHWSFFNVNTQADLDTARMHTAHGISQIHCASRGNAGG
jgi:molybdopterin-guanine dinucleotide biosynthesis protein A